MRSNEKLGKRIQKFIGNILVFRTNLNSSGILFYNGDY